MKASGTDKWKGKLRIEHGRTLRVTYDSNAWETVFDTARGTYEPLREAMTVGTIEGFICEAALQIESITKSARGHYFAQPSSDFRFEGIVERDGRKYLKASFGPNDNRHPGLPSVQAAKLQEASNHGVRLLRGLAWMGLPGPLEVREIMAYVSEPKEAGREQRQTEASALIDARLVGRAAFVAAGGWNVPTRGTGSEKRFSRACAEWSDGEMVCAHIAYQNDIICTNDFGRNAGKSILNPVNRAWLSTTFGTVFMTPDELAIMVR